VDPNSGTAALLEIARGLGSLLKSGWKPKRTVLASWSGEELGLMGSTAWGEANAKSLVQKAVAYLNCEWTSILLQFFFLSDLIAMATLLCHSTGDTGVSGPYFAVGE